MTYLPPRDPQSPPRTAPGWTRLLLWSGAGLVGVSVVGGVGVSWWVREQLAPMIETQLTQSLKRPLKIGKLEQFSVNRVRFGSSFLPATERDPNHFSTQGVEASFSLADLLFQRQLGLNLRLIQPVGYLQETQGRNWIRFEMTPSPPGFLKIEIKSVQVEKADLTLVPFSPQGEKKSSPISLAVSQGKGIFESENQRIFVDLDALFNRGGKIKLKGDSILSTGETKLQLQAHQIDVPEVFRLAGISGVNFSQGSVNTQLGVHLKNHQLWAINGTTNFSKIQGKIKGVKGTVKAEGQWRFKGTKLTIDSLKTSLDNIPLSVQGVIQFNPQLDWSQFQFNLSTEIPSVSVENLLKTVKRETGQSLSLPVAVMGDLGMKTRIQGNLEKPLITGSLKTLKSAQVERILLDEISTNFKLDLPTSTLGIQTLTIKPTVGGIITGNGEIKLPFPPLKLANLVKNNSPKSVNQNQNSQPVNPPPSGLVLALKAENLPGDIFTSLYATPTLFKLLQNNQISLGNINAQAELSGSFEKLEGRLDWKMPQATYPLNGTIRLANQTANLEQINVNIAGGTIGINGQLNQQTWQGIISTNDIKLHALLSELRLLKNTDQTPLFNLPDSQTFPNGLINTRIELLGNYRHKPEEITALGVGSIQLENSQGIASGQINFRGELGLGNWRGIIETNSVNVREFQPILTQFLSTNSSLIFPPQFAGIFQGRLELSGQLNAQNLSPLIANASGELFLPQNTGYVNIKGELIGGNWTASLGAKDINIKEIQGGFVSLGLLSSPLPQNLSGQFQGDINLSGNLANFNPETLLVEGVGQVNLGEGKGTVNLKGILAEGEWKAQVNTDTLNLSSLQPILQTTLKETQFSQVFSHHLLGELVGEVELKGRGLNFTTQSIFGRGSVSVNLGNGGEQIKLDGSLDQGKWNGVISSNSLRLKTLEPSLLAMGILEKNIPVGLNGKIQGRFLLSGNVEDQSRIQLQGTSRFTLPNQGGEIDIIARTKNGNWNASLESNQLQLGRFQSLFPDQSFPLVGVLKGQINLTGNFEELTPEAIQGKGRFFLSENPLDQTPLKTAFQWDGKRIIIEEMSSPHLRAQGLIALNFSPSYFPTISQIELNVKADQFNLLNLPFNRPLTSQFSAVNQDENTPFVQGLLNFNGQIRGSSLSTIETTGVLSLSNLTVNQIEFDPRLSGNIQLGLQSGLNLDLQGEKDHIQLALNSAFLPVSFQVRRAQMLASGQLEGENFLFNLEQFPLELLNSAIAPFTGGERIAGKATGKLTIFAWKSILAQGFSAPNSINSLLDSLHASGNFSIRSPEIGYIKGERFEMGFRYHKGQAIFDQGLLTLGESQYQFMGTFAANNTPQFQGKLTVQEGRLQDILVALKYFNLSDLARGLKPPIYGKADQVQPLPVGNVDTTLFKQLQRLSEIDEILEEERARQDAAKIPPLNELQGKFTGEIHAFASLKSGLEAQFKLTGQNWQWGNYKTDDISVEGGFKEGTLTILPLRISAGDTLIGFAGQINEKAQSGQLRVKNIPLEEIANFVELPFVDVTGRLNLRATLAGTLENPQATGELSLLDGTLNREPIKKAEGGFSYNNGRLSFGGNALITESEPIELIGTLPFTLPFARVKSESDTLDMKVNVKNEGLGIINILTPAIAWETGKGNLQLSIGGTLKNPIAEGIAQVENATLKARAFPEPLTGLTGTIRFVGDRINIEGLNGLFSRGKINVKGVIPLAESFFPNDPDLANPVRVSFDQLDLNLKGVYQGGVTGLLEVKGTALNPKVSGEIQLYKGQVFLGGGGGKSGSDSTGQGNPFDLEFDNLQINIAKGTRMINLPILAFLGQGNLAINGTLSNLQPQGVVRLTTGTVNLFTTQFRLARGYTHTATFIPSQGLDPNLDVRLVTSVPEVLRYRRPSSALASEIDDPITDVGSARTVRINALVKGPASQLQNDLILTSSPARSREEIVALLGGTLVGALGSQSGTLALASVAGTSLFNNLESMIIQGTGLTEFRLFPTQIRRTSPSSQQDSNSSSSRLGLGLEVGTDLTNNLSFSILKILTTNQTPEYNLRYRINDNILLRGTTNFQDENRGSIEYEIRF